MTHFRVSHVAPLTPTTFQLTLTQLAGGEAFTFVPGQYAALTFTRFGRRVPVRCFSIASSAHTPGTIQFGIKIKGKFTQALSTLKVGDTVDVAGPYGSFTLAGKPDKPTLLLAGGIGITPFMSMIRYMRQPLVVPNRSPWFTASEMPARRHLPQSSPTFLGDCPISVP